MWTGESFWRLSLFDRSPHVDQKGKLIDPRNPTGSKPHLSVRGDASRFELARSSQRELAQVEIADSGSLDIAPLIQQPFSKSVYRIRSGFELSCRALEDSIE
jgi:hypothetical protein